MGDGAGRGGLKINVLCVENFPRGSPNFKINILCLIVVNYDHLLPEGLVIVWFAVGNDE